MNKQLLIISIICLLATGPVYASIDANAGFVIHTSSALYRANKSKAISAQQAARIVKSKYGGKVLKVHSIGSKNKKNYKVKLLKNSGHVISVTVDGNSGRVSGN